MVIRAFDLEPKISHQVFRHRVYFGFLEIGCAVLVAGYVCRASTVLLLAIGARRRLASREAQEGVATKSDGS